MDTRIRTENGRRKTTWSFLGQDSYYVDVGTYTAKQKISIPAPASGSALTYSVRIVAQACAAYNCSWPTLGSFAKAAEVPVPVMGLGGTVAAVVQGAAFDAEPSGQSPEAGWLLKIESADHFVTTKPITLTVEDSGAGGTVDSVEWTITPIGSRISQSTGDPIPFIKKNGRTASYTPASDTHGERQVTVTFNVTKDGKTCQVRKETTFKLFFRKGVFGTWRGR